MSFSPLCQLNGGCMGCCGHGFHSLPSIKEAIELNTLEFLQAHPQTEQELLAFRDRAYPLDLRQGVCRNLIEKDGQIFCPLHPQQNNGHDLREGHCDIDHLCKTAQEFQKWDHPTQEKFLKFIKEKNLPPLAYSIQMDNDFILAEFKQI